MDLIKKYPFTEVVDNGIEPWRKEGECWFEDLISEYPGWEKIILEFCEKMQNYLDSHKEEEFSIFQVKEKFGSIRFYAVAGLKIYDDIQNIVHVLEKESGKTCMVCGKSAKTVEINGHIVTLCEDCEDVVSNKVKQAMKNLILD